MVRVLMTDTPSLFRLLEPSLLRRSGCRIAAASTLSELLARARRDPPSVVILHPRSDGPAPVECVRELKGDPGLRRIPVLVLGDAPTAASCRDAGADATLVLPLGGRDLDAALADVVREAARSDPRRPARWPVRLTTEHGVLRARLKDISRSGAFLLVPRAQPVRGELALTLQVPEPGGPTEVRTSAVVVRQVEEQAGSHLLAGVGVRFTGTADAARAAIDHYVDRTVGPDPAEGDLPDE